MEAEMIELAYRAAVSILVGGAIGLGTALSITAVHRRWRHRLAIWCMEMINHIFYWGMDTLMEKQEGEDNGRITE